MRRLLAEVGVDVNMKDEVGVLPMGIRDILILNDKVGRFKKVEIR